MPDGNYQAKENLKAKQERLLSEIAELKAEVARKVRQPIGLMKQVKGKKKRKRVVTFAMDNKRHKES